MGCASKPPVCAGQLNRAVEFLERQDTQDADLQFGAETALTVVLSTRAKLEFDSGTESTDHERVHARANYKVTIRYNSILDMSPGPKLLMRYKGRIFNIRASNNWEERNQYLILRVQEGVAS